MLWCGVCSPAVRELVPGSTPVFAEDALAFLCCVPVPATGWWFVVAIVRPTFLFFSAVHAFCSVSGQYTPITCEKRASLCDCLCCRFFFSCLPFGRFVHLVNAFTKPAMRSYMGIMFVCISSLMLRRIVNSSFALLRHTCSFSRLCPYFSFSSLFWLRCCRRLHCFHFAFQHF